MKEMSTGDGIRTGLARLGDFFGFTCREMEIYSPPLPQFPTVNESFLGRCFFCDLSVFGTVLLVRSI